MFNFFRKNYFIVLSALLLLSNMSSLMADFGDDYYSTCCDPCNVTCCDVSCNRLYIGGFGGGLYSDNHTRIIQRGTAFFPEAVGGPLAVDARGNTRHNSVGFGGVQVGYEWLECPLYIGCTDWSISPTAEFEALWYSHKKRGDLINPTARLPEHDFHNSFPMNVGVYLFNGIFSLHNCCLGSFSPYVGGGIGAACISIRKARSTQISPAEPGINHFNSDRGDTSFTFAAQVKAGLRYNFCDRFHIFGEYRFLYLDSSRYILGSTNYPTHAPTSPWNIDVKDMTYNAFVFGLQFDL